MDIKMQIGTSRTGNLQKGTWTFDFENEMYIKAGTFAIIDISKISMNDMEKLKEFVKNQL